MRRVSGLAALGVLAQIAAPLLSGTALRAAIIASVLLLAGAALTHLGMRAGWRAAGVLLVVAAGIGMAAEVIGVHTGVPFGRYHYSGALGPRVGGVPWLVPMAWMMLAYPALLLGRRLSGGARARTALLGGVALAGWDLFLDPQMVAYGYWHWQHPSPSLPGVPGVPLTNYAGWLVVSVPMVAALDAGLGRVSRASSDELVPGAVLIWTWLGSTLGNLAFFGRPWVALWGGVVMGAVVLPYVLHLARDVPAGPDSAPTLVEVAS